MIKEVVFDIDDTLYDYEKATRWAWSVWRNMPKKSLELPKRIFGANTSG